MNVDIDDLDFDSVHFLLNNSFSKLTFEEKLKIKSKRRKPNLNITEKDGKTVRKFQYTWYNKYVWLTGYSCVSEDKTINRLHCFYCLMFNGEEPWNKTGVSKIKNFEAKAKKHAASKIHIQCAEFYHTLGKVRIDHSISAAIRQQDIKHNEIVTANRRILSRLIDVVCFLGQQELAFRGHDESENSLNRGNYLQLLKLLATEESFIRDHLESNTVFKGTSPDIQNELIDAVSIAIKEQIKTEASEALFVSLQADETTDITVTAQMSLIIRYVYKSKIHERFLGFFDVSADKTSNGLSKVIFEQLDKWGINKEKLICQTYDGASTMSGNKHSVHTIINEKFPKATFIHCYAHQLNLVLLYGAKNIKEVKLFICNLTAFHTFFSRSSGRTELLRNRGFRLPSSSDTRWNFHSRGVFTIKKYYIELAEIFQKIIDSDDWDPVTTNSAIGLNKILKNPKFIYFLFVYDRIFTFTNHLYNLLQKKSIDINLCLNEIKSVHKNVSLLHSDTFVDECVEAARTLNPDVCENLSSSSMRRITFEIIDSFLTQYNRRFENYENIIFVELLNSSKFLEYRKKFPENLLHQLCKHFTEFDKETLKGELLNIYSNDSKILSASELLVFIEENDLKDVYAETVKLITLILTYPITTASCERSMSTLKRIKTYLRNTMTNIRLSNLATISIENVFIKNEAFKNRVIEIFATQKTRRMELIYKNIV